MLDQTTLISSHPAAISMKIMKNFFTARSPVYVSVGLGAVRTFYRSPCLRPRRNLCAIPGFGKADGGQSAFNAPLPAAASAPA